MRNIFKPTFLDPLPETHLFFIWPNLVRLHDLKVCKGAGKLAAFVGLDITEKMLKVK